MHYIKNTNKVVWVEPRLKQTNKRPSYHPYFENICLQWCFILNVIQIVRCHMRSHLMKITKEQDKIEGTKIWICNYIIKIRTSCLLPLRALNHSLLFAYLFKGLVIDSLTLKWVLFYLINYISGARNVLVISYRSEGMGRRERGKEGRMEGEREREWEGGRKKTLLLQLCLLVLLVPALQQWRQNLLFLPQLA